MLQKGADIGSVPAIEDKGCPFGGRKNVIPRGRSLIALERGQHQCRADAIGIQNELTQWLSGEEVRVIEADDHACGQLGRRAPRHRSIAGPTAVLENLQETRLACACGARDENVVVVLRHPRPEILRRPDAHERLIG
ncbi:MAG: hypothetical protein ABR616_14885 [Dermatophilaceae bacterium]